MTIAVLIPLRGGAAFSEKYLFSTSEVNAGSSR
jgi:hypothetical protein